ncbi:2-phospho-L-lactate guanylyltransferase [Amycolatopsis sp. H20-H5]|uniref:2-phospho-L-lactate guanylyltransferase n=1 Tax=Amycolatopsis sp. H20-H5 TaxID=3046309 RepID=UPI002DB5D59E|nr:2-phospho-L-lactate guanylyltransferase [Amycolatopsis sp. H20-H5]MEC3973767.1 2-phospho-L-lactate guanylyltransferase [Amycolatopsis sp. H20-H5]
MDVDLIVPMKRPHEGKSRLRGALPDERHAGLVLALAFDTLTAVTSAAGVRRVLVVAADPAALAELRELGVELIAEPGPGGLNSALRHGESVLRRDDPAGVVGALQADLPALRAEDLTAALAEAAGRRAFTADRQGTGTTLLLSAAGRALDPRFGVGSAAAHARSGAFPLTVPVLSLRSDVDTSDDLGHACALGVGKHTAAMLGEPCLPR